MNEVKQIGNYETESTWDNPQTGRVYSVDGISPTLNTCNGGNRQPMIIDDFYKNREPRAYDETVPTIRAEREGLKVIEEKTIAVGGIYTDVSNGGYVPIVVEDYLMPGNNFNQCNKVHPENGICRTIIGQGHAGNEPKVIVASRGRNPGNPSDRKQGIELEQRLEPNSEGICNTLTSVQKDNLLLTPNNWKHKAGDGTKTRSRRISEIHPALQANTGASQQTYLAETPYRIRKLTPKECAKLMKFSDEDANKMLEVNSNTQVYKQCGNSIVVSVLEAIFCQMNIKGCPTWEEQSKKYL